MSTQHDPHDLFLDLTITILDDCQENLMKISCKINKNILKLETVKVFIRNILSKVHELSRNPPLPLPPLVTPTLTPDGKFEVELHNGKYENYVYYDSLHPLLHHLTPTEKSHGFGGDEIRYENDEHKIAISCYSENAIPFFLTKYQPDFFENYIFVIGSHENSLFLYDNWCLSDSISIREVIRIIEDRTAEYYLSNDRSGNSFRLLQQGSASSLFASTPSSPIRSSNAVTATSRKQEEDREMGDEAKSLHHSASLTPPPQQSLLKFQRDELMEICESISLVMTSKSSLPKQILRISIRAFRSSDSPTGKTFTIHHVLVRQDGHEWMLQYRYSDFARLHEQLLSQDEAVPGFIPKQSLPHLPSKKLFTAR
jgi:hypothetical protein